VSIFRKDLYQGKVAFITGGGTGICKGIAIGLAKHGAKTVIVSRKAENVESAAEEIRAAGGVCLPLVADVRSFEQIQQAASRAVAELGSIDLLVNGAAGNFLCPAAQLSPNGFSTVIDIDTKGTFNTTKAVFDTWMSSHGGRVVNISATLQIGGTPMQIHASAAKAAIDAMTKNLAVEWGPLGIRVNAIAPGGIGDTEGARRLIPEGFHEKLVKSIPIRRLGTIDDVVNLTLFLFSDAADNIHGEVIVTDGGHSLVGAYLSLDALG
jgi:peroxisomal 2,4-dienoyl-CoA reductase